MNDMWTKVLHFFALLSFLNMLTFDKSKHMELLFGANEVVTDTLVEFILEDIMDLDSYPVSDPEDPEIVYEDFRGIATNLNVILPVFFFFAGYIFSKSDIYQCNDHPNYFSKMRCEPGYYTFLYRLRLF